MGGRLQFWLGISLSLLSLAAIFFFIDARDILNSIKGVRIPLLLLAALSLVIFMLLRAIRWNFLLNSRTKNGRVDYQTVFHIQNVGYMFSNLLPFRVGDLLRAVLIGNVPPLTVGKGLSTMVVERILDLLLMVLLFPILVPIASEIPQQVRTAVSFTGMVAMGVLLAIIVAANKHGWATSLARTVLFRIPSIDRATWLRRVEDLLEGFEPFSDWRRGSILALLSIIVWIPIFLGYYVGMQSVGLRPTLPQALFVVCIAAFSVAIPSSPGQAGVFEAGVTFAIGLLLEMDEAKAASFAFIYHAINYIVLGLFGAIGIYATGSTFGRIVGMARKLIRSGVTEP